MNLFSMDLEDEKSDFSEGLSTGRDGTSEGSPSSTDDEAAFKGNLAGDENNVRTARRLVEIVYVICACVVTVAVFFLVRQGDEAAFEVEYDGYVNDIIPLVVWEARYNIALMEQLSAQITIATELQNSSFPFHTEASYEITGGFVDGMGGIMAAAFAPLVTEDEREDWESYAVENQEWLENSKYLKKVHGVHRDALHGTIQDHEHDRRRLQLADDQSNKISSAIFHWENGVKVVESSEPGKLYAPLWQVSPADPVAVNANLFADPRISELYDVMERAGHGVVSANTEIGDLFDFLFDETEKDQKESPHGLILLPIHEAFVETNPKIVGIVIGVTVFGNLLDRLLPEGKDGIIAVLKDTCGNSISYELTSGKALFLGYGDVHETKFDEFEGFQENIELYANIVDGLCSHNLHIYPSSKFRDSFDTSKPYLYAGVVALSFLFTALLMFVYDRMVSRRQEKTLKVAARTGAIVTSLFPKEIGRKLVEEAVNANNPSQDKGTHEKTRMGRFHNIMSSDGKILKESPMSSAPLADLFPEATVMFGDLVGFTAWASTREPSQVFMLLESLYSSFDKIAIRRKVFKVETVGDCYVAVCGVPEAREDHAATMVRFARDCLDVMLDVFNQLTVELGPDTSDLGMRVGLHSGPVTAGVLRGDRARFQLFGDVVNTTARLESTGERNRIHTSKETAELLIASGKESWVVPREESIYAKGKGLIKTYWVKTKMDLAGSISARSRRDSSGTGSITHSDPSDSNGDMDLSPSALASEGDMRAKRVSTFLAKEDKDRRVIDWTVEVLFGLLQEIESSRQAKMEAGDRPDILWTMEQSILKSEANPYGELQPFFKLPRYNGRRQIQENGNDKGTVKLDPIVAKQLRAYVLEIATRYHKNPFHNFEHASHVMLSVIKLLKRIVAPAHVVESSTTEDDSTNNNLDAALHDHTYGITSDPLTQFTVVLSALLHDVDHEGVPNSCLIQEGYPIAEEYNGKSVAEQNSVSVSWRILMEDRFQALRGVIYQTQADLKRFRQMFVHNILATDIMDKEETLKRSERWYKTFGGDDENMFDQHTITDIKATIVIEHLMQASDVAHTMQHWHVYCKWNARLFEEMYRAYKQERSGKNPADGWYEGEIGFFDHYILPLAHKLKSCGVFGVSSAEYLSYAQQNRVEWESKGKDIVARMVAEAEEKYGVTRQ